MCTPLQGSAPGPVRQLLPVAVAAPLLVLLLAVRPLLAADTTAPATAPVTLPAVCSVPTLAY